MATMGVGYLITGYLEAERLMESFREESWVLAGGDLLPDYC